MPRSRLRIAVLGAGAVGCHLGGHLARCADVTLIGRPRVVDAVRAHGLTLTGGDRTLHVPADALRATTEPTGVADADVVLVTTKTTGTDQAVAEVAAQLPTDCVIISFQNGLRSATTINDALRPIFPSAAARPLVLEGMVPYNIAQTGVATFHRGTSGVLVVRDHPRVDPFLQTARDSGPAIEPRPDIDGVLAAKLLFGLNHAVHALSGLSLRDELADRDLRRVTALCMSEALAVYAKAGLRPTRITRVPPRAFVSVLRAPTPVFLLAARRALRVDPRASSSMAEDFARGNRTEIDEFQGRISELGAAHGVPTPVSDRVAQLVRQVEQTPLPHRAWTGPDLLAHVTRTT